MSEWQAFAQIEPFGQERELADLRTGLLATLLQASAGVKDPASPGDWFKAENTRPKQSSPEELERQVQVWVAACGGQIAGRQRRKRTARKAAARGRQQH